MTVCRALGERIGSTEAVSFQALVGRVRRRYAEYRPSTWGRRRLRSYGLFRSAQLDLVGWMAVAALCLVGAATGYWISLLVGGPVAVWLVIGALLWLVTLVVVDRRRWGQLWTGYSWGDTPQATESVGRELKRRGLVVVTRIYPGGRVGLRYRNRDGRQVARALSQLGIRPPRGW
jgi:hypothetical protein